MFKNFFLIAVRNIIRYIVFILINVASLAVGLAVSFLILLWSHEDIALSAIVFQAYKATGINHAEALKVE
jgi:hypothetical protein